MGGHERKPWYQIQWFSDDDTHAERKLILKVDLLIVPYAFLAYWTKYIDQANLSKFFKRNRPLLIVHFLYTYQNKMTDSFLQIMRMSRG